MHRKFTYITATVITLVLLSSCGGNRTKDGAPRGRASIPDLPGDAQPRPEPRSRYGNGPAYEVFGKRYTVMDSSSGYAERGVASWYGKKFHGRLTSNREQYNMYAMTAAHKTLPLPTYVRVRNLRNNKSVVVRVNDRGPFVHNRIIDLSYAAALRLNMVGDGTSLVEVTAITFDEPAGDRPVRVTKTPTPAAPPKPIEEIQSAQPEPLPSRQRSDVQAQAAEPEPLLPTEQNSVYAQVGAFGSRENAQRRHQLLLDRGIKNSFVHVDTNVEPNLYRVKVGPIIEVIQYDVLVEELENLGITDPYLVTD